MQIYYIVVTIVQIKLTYCVDIYICYPLLAIVQSLIGIYV